MSRLADSRRRTRLADRRVLVLSDCHPLQYHGEPALDAFQEWCLIELGAYAHQKEEQDRMKEKEKVGVMTKKRRGRWSPRQAGKGL